MRLIDADELIKDVLDLQDCYNGFSDTFDKACIIGVIDEQPTIEHERKNGKWIHYDEGDFDYDYKCSNCGCAVWDDSDFCPNCGADMRLNNVC